ncbi:bifunctional diguanylate cyclase/phosphodiesterase [Ovoidimarina sediminis]|uniref:bifunctional diguanylate cyclase/phosphodiesterase n=1 Tax=Ovoidimarina sediminis TaxID=3079856 RepID=UPI00290788B7|nr:EAL domain-containing protein [Rhodophyticola sp. MJ-SS7]MDU8943597.1 EAL domain-containing protein [Rhodophyticola sp. MJ-SS7]
MPSHKQAALDLVACEQEPIHAPEAIQAACALLLFDIRTQKLVAASDNLEAYFGENVRDLIGHGPDRFVRAPDDKALAGFMENPSKTPVSRHLELAGPGEQWVRLFRTEDLLGVEIDTFENAEEDVVTNGLGTGDAIHEMAELAAQAGSARTEEIRHLTAMVAGGFRRLSGYDRVMIYRFDTDWNGDVIAESRADHVADSFLGLSFPSSDIPRQARALFLRNRLRPIIDLSRPPVPLVPGRHPATGGPIDLSDCSVRGVSPVHVEYLQNMGVGATLNIALVVDRQLWGLISCHHYTPPYRLTPGRSSACQIFAEAFSATLTQIADRENSRTLTDVRAAMADLRNRAMQDGAAGAMEGIPGDSEETLLRMVNADGLYLRLENTEYMFGAVPEPGLLTELRERIAVQLTGDAQVFSTHFAAGLWEDLERRLLPGAAGLLACRGQSGLYELIAFRKQRELQLTWGGDPYKRVQPQSADERLHPRASFEKYGEKVENRSTPWTRSDQIAAQETATGLSEIGWLLEWRRSEARLAAARAKTERKALHDSLTELPNRRHLSHVFDTKGSAFSTLLHIDLDGFKQINETAGHMTGDHVLTVAAERLRGVCREGDFCARIGGDEFIVLTRAGTDLETTRRLGQQIISRMSREVDHDGEAYRFGASVGVADIGGGNHPLDHILHCADVALNESKRNGRGTVTVFSQELEDRLLKKKKMSDEIQNGIRDDQFKPWYQPQFSADTHELVGVEALIRWNHPVQGVLAPERFLSLAEGMDQIATIDAISLRKAIEDNRRWSAAGLNIPKIFLNLSARRLSDPQLVDDVKGADIPTDKLSFELLETIYLDEMDDAMDWTIDALRDLGITLQVDDFGTGRTSIVGLVRLRPDRLKIDRQLVDPIVRSEQARALIASIVEIGQSLGIGVTAEGVETMEHAQLLRELGCTVLQGFAFARPMTADDLAKFLLGRRHRVA